MLSSLLLKDCLPFRNHPTKTSPIQTPHRYPPINITTTRTMAKAQKDPEIIEIARTLENTPWCEEYEKMVSGMM